MQGPFNHLEGIRQKEIAEKKINNIPEELTYFKRCVVFDEKKFEEIKQLEQSDVCIGKVNLDGDEKAILRLNPNFAITKYLDEEEAERDVELGLAKIRYEIRKLSEEKKNKEYDFEENRKRKRKKHNNIVDAA